MESVVPPPVPPLSIKEPPDRLTIRRLLLLMVGTAVGLTLFAPRLGPNDLTRTESWREVSFSVIIGLTLPAPLFAIRYRFRRRGLGSGGLFALAIGLGVWLMLPAALIDLIERMRSPANMRNAVGACLYFVMPMMGLWYLLAGLASGHVSRRLVSPGTPWIDRYGYLLALLWTPLGAWHVVDVYRDVL